MSNPVILRAYLIYTWSYVYVPLGGSDNVILATLVSFTFVALWHDLHLRLLAWGWLITLFVLPELILNKIFTDKKASSLNFATYTLTGNYSLGTHGGSGMLVP